MHNLHLIQDLLYFMCYVYEVSSAASLTPHFTVFSQGRLSTKCVGLKLTWKYTVKSGTRQVNIRSRRRDPSSLKIVCLTSRAAYRNAILPVVITKISSLITTLYVYHIYIYFRLVLQCLETMFFREHQWFKRWISVAWLFFHITLNLSSHQGPFFFSN